MAKRSYLYICLLFLTACSFTSNEDILQEINRNLEIMIHSPVNSAKPHAYVTKHREEFNYIVNQGDLALDHLLNEFEVTTEDGLKEYIMALICVEILGDKNPVFYWQSGRAWYEHYMMLKEN